MKTITLFLALFSSTLFAADANTAYDLFCKNLSFEAERKECMSIIKPYNHFDDKALFICSNLTFTSERLDCLKIVAGKTYQPYEIDTCTRLVFNSERINCLKEFGVKYTCHSRDAIVNQLHNAVTEIRTQKQADAVRRLNLLISNLTAACPNN